MEVDLDKAAARYDPEIERVPELSGLSLNAAREGESVKVLQRAFFSSYDDDHRHYFGQILGQFPSLTATLPNDLLIVIRDQEARIHKAFPLMMNIRPKVAIQRGRAVFQDQILDIEEVRFRDAVFEADIRDGDKIVWLFRVDWSFGLYFDFSGQSTIPELWKTLGQCYGAMQFHAVYAFFSNPANPERLIDRGLVSVHPVLYRRISSASSWDSPPIGTGRHRESHCPSVHGQADRSPFTGLVD